MSELEEFICGKFLGSGIARKAYIFRPDKELVIKVAEDRGGQSHNLVEWKIWEELKYCKEASKWLAPVIDVSDSGKYLIMKRAEMGRKADYPEMVPKFFTDLKYQNYGFIGKQLVCVDYANFIITNGFKFGLKKADWWE